MPNINRLLSCTGEMLAYFVIFTLLGITLSSSSGTNKDQKYFLIQEGRPPNTFVGNLSKSIKYLQGIPKQFNVDKVTGVITSASTLDRETKSSYRFVVLSKSDNQLIYVHIKVEDINDETPEFSSLNKTIVISEAHDVGYEHDVGKVTDRDEGLNSVHNDTIRILSGNDGGVFNLNLRKFGENSYRLYLEIAVKLKHSVQNKYVMNISASDKGNPMRIGYMLLTVIVEDYNDCFPRFSRQHYSAVVSESAPKMTTVLNITTTDCDFGKNAEVKYQMDDAFDKDRFFGIRQLGKVGFVRTNLNLDYETITKYNLRVIATDLGNPPKTSSVGVVIHVMDENDNSPEIGAFTFEAVNEDAPVQSKVASVTILDRDSGRNAMLNVMLEPKDVFYIKNVSKDLYFVYLKASLDRETKKSYKIIVTATDNGLPPRASRNADTLTIGDVNDNPPQFEQSEYVKDILESIKVGSFILRVHATDPDTVSTLSITYHLVSTKNTSYSPWFWINSTSGDIYVASSIDHEKVSKAFLNVVARDGGVQGYSANCTVILTILDVNDNAPEFSEEQYVASVRENCQPGKFVVQIMAFDRDFSKNGTIFYFFDLKFSPPKDVFSIDMLTGNITTLKKLDRELTEEYQFGVIAQDQGGLNSTAKVKVIVEDVNDNHPFFKPDFYNISLLENVTVGTQLVQLQAFDNDSGWNALISYEIISGNTGDTFKLDKSNGLVTLQRNLDREKIDKYLLKFRAIDNSGWTSETLAQVQIGVLDVNDDPPVFLEKTYSFHVVENALLPVFIGAVEAASQDQGPGGVISYSIKTSGARKFFSVNESGAVFTKVTFDYEIQSKYLFTVEARDHGSPPLFGHVNVTVSIKDSNDNPPVWHDQKIMIKLVENMSVGKAFYTFNASDNDSGKNGEVMYNITAGSNDVFDLSPTTGELSLLMPVDYELVKSYQLTVMASDSGFPSLSASIIVYVGIEDYNDNNPVLNESLVYVSEALPVQSVIFNFHAVDKDSGQNGKVWYKLADSVAEKTFELSSDGVLSLKTPLDREKQDKYEIYVIAGDFGQPHKTTAPTKFTIHVSDVNDETPRFLKKFTFTTTENKPPGTDIGTLTAVDRDIGLNSTLQYSLVNSTGIFIIDSKTGVLKNKVILDRDKIPVYNVEVFVSDMGVPPRSSKTIVYIYVQDVNDNAPEFTQASYKAQVPEDVMKGTTVMQVRAYDRDEGQNGRVVYSLLTGNTQGGVKMFQINNVTGKIFIVAALDREIKQYFVLSVVANDKGHPPRSNICQVLVTVLDVNDHSPEFKFKNDSVNVSERRRVGTIVYMANATDLDEGENGNIMYSIVSQSPDEMAFTIDSISGVIMLNQGLDYESTKQYILEVKASDKAEKSPKQSILQLYINVLDSNDNSPTFSANPIFTTVKEGVPRGTKVHDPITATDEDSDENSRILYSITAQAPKAAFKIDPSSGQLTTDVEIDREDVPEYTLNVKAIDQAAVIAEQLSSTVTVKIIVVDVNDCPPVFTSRNDTFVMEDEPLNYTVFTFTAEDKDSKEGGKVTFSIVGGNDDGIFELDPLWGSLILKASLDREQVESYELKIKASDGGKPPLSTTITFAISVQDVNDNVPLFSNHWYQASVKENENSSDVLTVHATDADSGPRGELFYSIPTGIADDMFIINQSSGVISTKAPLDRERKEVYQLTVYVRDNFYPKYTDSAAVTITVEDKNDNAPVFLQESFEVKIPENQPPGYVCSLVAQDIDEGKNSELVYSIDTGNHLGYFAVDKTTGILSTRRPLDREEKAIHVLRVRVRDMGYASLSSSVNLTVIVLDDNDNAPRFITNELNVSLPGNCLPGTSVVQLAAVDDDEGLSSGIYYSFGSRERLPFGLDATSGLIYTLTYLNSSEIRNYSFFVTASDGNGFAPLTQSIRVNVYVDYTINIPLRFTEIFYEVNFTSDVQPGIDILQLKLKNENLNAGDVEYHSENGQTVLAVGSTRGNVSFATKPNRGAYVFSVRATLVRDRSNTAVCFVLVTVQHSNQLPSFVSTVYYSTVDENTPAGTSIATILPRTSGNPYYQIVNGNEFNAFQISRNGNITVDNASALDFERTQNFELDVKGDWGSVVTNIAFAKVYVTIRNLDDKAPVFRQRVFTSSIPEGTVSLNRGFVTNLYAFNFGSTYMSFDILSGNQDDVFLLSSSTGELRLQKTVNREHNKLYNLSVIVRQGGLSSQSIVLVHITDINDNPPILPSKFHFSVSENSPPGSPVGLVTAVDADDSSVLRYTFGNKMQRQGPFVLDLYTGTLRVFNKLDYETRAIFTAIDIMVSDNQTETKTKVTVAIRDENDNKPSFEKSSYTIQRKEVIPVNYDLVQVNATDKDEGANGNIFYSMTSVEGLTIDPKSGTISTTKPLVNNPFNVTIDVVITATDGGLPPLSTKVPFRLRVLDTNNNPPKFQNVSYDERIPENAKIGTFVVRIQATDSDPSSSNRKIWYKIMHGDEWGKFRIEERTGIIRVQGKLDREEKDQYSLLIIVKDDTLNPDNEDQITARITILDVNDNAPVFQPNKYYRRHGNESKYQTTLIEDAEQNTTVLNVLATDKDVGHNKDVGYSISSGNDGGWFSVNRTGHLSLINSLDRDVIPIHRLSVRASDKGKPPKASDISVVIRVADINDNAPVFVQPKNLGVLENADPGSLVGTIKASDSDSGDNQLIYYSLINGTAFFAIKSLTGELTTRVKFDYEEKSSYTLVIKAEDQGTPRRSSILSAGVEIRSVDEFSPRFKNDSYPFVVPGNSEEGKVLGRVRAEDADAGPDGVVNYELVSPVEPFAVNKSSGDIYLTENFLDYLAKKGDTEKRKRRSTVEKSGNQGTAAPDSYSLKIKASSGRPGSKSAVVAAIMTIDYTCPGCRPTQAPRDSGDPDTETVLMVVLGVVGFLVAFCVLICLFMACRRKRGERNKKGNAEEMKLKHMSSVNSVKMGVVNQYNHVPASVSNSPASGTPSNTPGSSDGYPDEVAMKTTDLDSSNLEHGPDSGVQADFESGHHSLASDVENSEARLSDIRSDKSDRVFSYLESRESLHEFHDEGGKEASAGIDVGNLLFAKLAEADAEEDDQNVDHTRVFAVEGRPDYTTSLSSILGSREELRGHYNYFYSMNQGPQYQPLSEVFSEIGRLPVHDSSKENTLQCSSNGQNDISSRTSLLSSVSSLHNQHLDVESTYSSLPMTPNFTPAITPLVTRSPSISPLTSEAVTPMVSPSQSRPSSMYLSKPGAASSMVQLAEQSGLDGFDDVNV